MPFLTAVTALLFTLTPPLTLFVLLIRHSSSLVIVFLVSAFFHALSTLLASLPLLLLNMSYSKASTSSQHKSLMFSVAVVMGGLVYEGGRYLLFLVLISGIKKFAKAAKTFVTLLPGDIIAGALAAGFSFSLETLG